MRGAVVLIVSIGLLAVACAAPSAPPNAPTPSAPTPSGERPAEPSPEQTATAGAPGPSETPAPAIAAEPPPIALEEVTRGLEAPIGITVTPDGLLLVNERVGRVVAVAPASGDRSVVLDITDRVLGEGERGLLGLVLHPDWPDDSRAFVHYTDRGGDTVLSEFDAPADGQGGLTFDLASERVLLQVDQPYANHNGGQLAFGFDRLLYMALGDGGSGGDPHGHGQNPATLLGSILRLDVSEPDGYAIPDDAPFADDTGAPEVHLYGLRNPWRFSFDRLTGQLWIADVGQNAYEEIDRVDPTADAGANLGWNVMEASHCFADAGCSAEGLVLPVAEYGRDLGCSVSGGHVYRGSAIDGLWGWYLFGDYCSGLLMAVRSDADPAEGVQTATVLLETGLSISAFGEGADGALYVADIGAGGIYRIVPAP